MQTVIVNKTIHTSTFLYGLPKIGLERSSFLVMKDLFWLGLNAQTSIKSQTSYIAIVFKVLKERTEL